MNLNNTHNVTSSPVSADGLSHFNSPDGLQLDLFGQDQLPANLSAPPENNSEIKTSVTFGQSSSTLSASADLSASLGSRLQMQLGKDGLMEYRQTWKEQVTPAGRRFWAHTASAHRTSDSDCSGWPTPQEDNANNAYGHVGTTFSDLPTTAQLTGWPTPQASEADHGGPNARDSNGRLHMGALVAGWPTPLSGDAHLSSKPEAAMRRIEEGKLTVSRVAAIAGWPTPNASEQTGRESLESKKLRGSGGINLHEAAYLAGSESSTPTNAFTKNGTKIVSNPSAQSVPENMVDGEPGSSADVQDQPKKDMSLMNATACSTVAGWPTPSTRDHKGGYEGGRIRNGKISTDTLDVVAQIAGQTTISSPVATEKRGGLNPALPRWLMGFPPEWCDCAVTAMQSFPKSRRNSSKPS